MVEHSCIYALIISDKTILVEAYHPKFDDQNVKKLAYQGYLKFQKTATIEGNKLAYIDQGFQFNFRYVKGITYICVAQEGFGKSMGFVFLRDVINSFQQHYSTILFPVSAASAIPFDPRSFVDYPPVLIEKLRAFSGDDLEDASLKKTEDVKTQLEDCKNIMLDNLTRVIDQSEELHIIAERSEDLTLTSQAFRFRSKRLTNTLWYQEIKCKLFMILVILIILGIFILVICQACTDSIFS